MTLENKLQVVTGGTSGMGLATAKALSEFGPVLIGGRNEERLNNALEELKSEGIEAYGKTCDVSKPESLKEFADYAETIAPIGSLINAAGVDFDVASPEAIVKINMLGTHYVLEAFIDKLDDSTVVNFSSITGYYYPAKPKDFEVWMNPDSDDFIEKTLELVPPIQDQRAAHLGESYMPYCCSKRFVMYYTMANTQRVAEKNNSRIISIAPGSFMTPMLATQEENLEIIRKGTAFKRLGEPDEMASLIKALLSPGHEYLTGCDIIMDGGKYATSMIKQME